MSYTAYISKGSDPSVVLNGKENIGQVFSPVISKTKIKNSFNCSESLKFLWALLDLKKKERNVFLN